MMSLLTHKKSHLKDHLDYKNEICQMIYNSQTERLLEYNNFSLCYLMNCSSGALILIFLYSNKKIIDHVISNMSCVTGRDHDKWTLIHYFVCYLDDVKLIKYFIDKYCFDIYVKKKDQKLIYLSGRKKINNKEFLLQYLTNRYPDCT